MIFDGDEAQARLILAAMGQVARAGTDELTHRSWGATGDTFDADREMWSRVNRPLEDVRDVMGVPPLPPEDAADGEYPDWYEPTA